MTATDTTTQPAPGEVTITPDRGRLHVQIGRDRYTKHLSLSHDEATELHHALTQHLAPTAEQ